uniref:FMRFamide activated amiloride sensitive sodium n=1 Tax=Echinococcus granulosus TaxID=6210 RepID=A0A068WPC3_ECHGR|nr:FMRFamide activated amiloride sensitive sodium [Echinococcus granulosus]
MARVRFRTHLVNIKRSRIAYNITPRVKDHRQNKISCQLSPLLHLTPILLLTKTIYLKSSFLFRKDPGKKRLDRCQNTPIKLTQLKQTAKRQSKSANFEGSYAKQEEDESRFVELLRPYAAIHNMTTNGKEVEAVDLLMHMQDVEQNFLSIIVSRPNFDIIRAEEKAVVTLTSLFSQIGGLLSIWVGITMICIVEVAEFLLNCLDVLCDRIH